MWLHSWCLTDYKQSCFYKHLEYYCTVNVYFTMSLIISAHHVPVSCLSAICSPSPPSCSLLSHLFSLSLALSCVSCLFPVCDPMCILLTLHAPLTHICSWVLAHTYIHCTYIHWDNRQGLQVDLQTHTHKHTFPHYNQGLILGLKQEELCSTIFVCVL